MIDLNKSLETYSNKELLNALTSKNDKESYFLVQLLYEENKKSNKYYPLFDDFLEMIYDKSSFRRTRGFNLCSSLTKWDIKNKIDKHLEEMLILFEDEKPITVRSAISCAIDILKYKPYLAIKVRKNLNRIKPNKYKDSMSPLINKDIETINKVINDILSNKD